MELSTGAKINYDWNAITEREWRVLLAAKDKKIRDPILSKLVGIPVEGLLDLSPKDYQKLEAGAIKDYVSLKNLDDVKN